MVLLGRRDHRQGDSGAVRGMREAKWEYGARTCYGAWARYCAQVVVYASGEAA